MANMEISDEVVAFFENLNAEPATEEAPATETEQTTEQVVEGEEVAEETVEPVAETTETEEVVEPDPTVEQQEEQAEEQVNWEERYKHLQSQKDREVAQVNEQLQQLQQWAQQQYAWQQQLVADQQAQQQAQIAQQQVAVSREQVDASIDRDPLGTFRWVAFNRPDLMPNVISMVREKEALGHDMADAMSQEWTQFQLQQQQAQFQQALDERDQQLVQQAAPQQVEGTMQQIVGVLEERHGEPFKALSEDIATKAAEAAPAFQQYMAQNGLEITPQSVADFITQIYLDVREEKLNTVSQQPARPQKLTPQQHVENPGALRQQETTPDQDAMNELLQGARNLGIDVAAAASA